jgi:hypothetical protein
MKNNIRICSLLLLPVLIFILLFSTALPAVQASPDAFDQNAPALQKTPTPIPPQILNEGRPQGIIIGAVALVLIIIAGSILSFVRPRKVSDK